MRDNVIVNAGTSASSIPVPDQTYSHHKISVIIPAYNAASSITRALDSVKAQSLKEIETIIVDDGSTDFTRLAIMSYIEKHPKMDIIYLYQENAGPGAARNTGIEHATGDYITFMDADDKAPPGAYHSMYYTAQCWDCDVVIGSYMRQVSGKNWSVPEYIKNLCINMDGKNCAGNYQIVINNPSLWNRAYKREFLNTHKIRFLDERHGEDLVFNLDVVKKAAKIYTVDAITYFYGKRLAEQQSVSTSWTYKNTSSLIRAIKEYVLFFDGIGDVNSETVFLKMELAYLSHGLGKVADTAERDKLFEEFKEILVQYSGNRRYESLIDLIMGVKLEILLTLPYDSYMIQKRMIYYSTKSLKGEVYSRTFGNEEYKDIVLNQFLRGEVGFRYILRYIGAWIRYKLRRS